jgi:hypothetical protein
MRHGDFERISARYYLRPVREVVGQGPNASLLNGRAVHNSGDTI